MKPKPHIRAFALILALFLLCSAVPPRARAEDGNPYAASSVKDIIIKPASSEGHIRFGVAADIGELVIGEDGNAPEETVLSVAAALEKVCRDTFANNSAIVEGSFSFDYVSGLSLPATQGTLYDGFNTEGDTGAGVAGVQKYYGDTAPNASNDRISNIRFVPKTSFSGRATIDYYGYYSFKEEEPTEVEGGTRTVTRTGSYAGRIYITVSKQEPGIAYSTDGEPAQFAAEDFNAYVSAVTGRAFKYVSFRLPSATIGALYYNYISASIYDYAVAPAQRFYRADTPTVNRVFFVPAKDYAGEVVIEFSGVDSADAPFVGELVIHVTNSGPSHTQPSAEGPFVYRVASGRPVSLDERAFQEQVQLQIGVAETFRYFSLASLPSAESGTLYYDAASGSSHAVAVGVNYYWPQDMRFLANAGYSGIVSVPIVVTALSGKSFDSMLRFVITDEGDQPLRYKVEPERRVSLIASDFSDACYRETGYDLSHIVFDTLPPSSAGSLYYLNSTPVTTKANERYYLQNLEDVSFLANAGFTGEVSFAFTGYALGYTNRNGRVFRGTVTIVSTTVVEEKPTIGSTGGVLEYRTWGPAVSLSYQDIYSRAVSSLPGAPTAFSLSRPEDGTGQLCFDFVSLSNYTPFDATRSYLLSDASRVSYLPKAGFSGTSQITYTVSDASGNSYTGSIRFTVTPPVYSSYFSDMNDAVWAVQAVDFFRHYGATNGNSRAGFGPSDAMRRGDFLLLLQRLFVFPAAGASSYTDVSPDKYYAAAIASAKALGVVTDADTRKVPNPEYEAALQANPKAKPRVSATVMGFDPEAAITREDAALYLYRALRRAGKIQPGSAADLSRFPDAGSVSAASAEAMGALVRDGVFQGYVNNLLPKRTLSRAESMAVLYRAFT